MFDLTYFPGARYFWHNGEMYDWDSANIHVMTHALHYGSSVFEGIRAYDTEKGPAIFRLNDHLNRLMISSDILNMKVPWGKQELEKTIKQVMKANRLQAAYIRPNVFYSYGSPGVVPKASPVEVTIACWAWGAYLGEEALKSGVHVLLLPYRRVHNSQVDLRAKIGGLYAMSNISGTFARKLGFHEGVFLNLEGRIAEGTGENIILVQGNRLKTNDRSESILEGITRTTILQLAQDLGYSVEIGPITVEEMLGSDEVFFTGTAAEVIPITRVTDGSDPKKPQEEWKEFVIGSGKPGPVTQKLAGQYRAVVHGELPEYHHWLTYVYDSPEEFKQRFSE
jgi:branched-chain amino acid aminotransferase